MPETSDVEDLWTRSIEARARAGIVAPGDRVVITAGTAVNMPGSTNVIKVESRSGGTRAGSPTSPLLLPEWLIRTWGVASRAVRPSDRSGTRVESDLVTDCCFVASEQDG